MTDIVGTLGSDTLVGGIANDHLSGPDGEGDDTLLGGGTTLNLGTFSNQVNRSTGADAGIFEVAFIDPGIADIETVLQGLRPGVEAIVLSPKQPARMCEDRHIYPS